MQSSCMVFTVNALHLRDPRSDKHPLLYHIVVDCQEKSDGGWGFAGEFSKTVWGWNGLNSYSQTRYPIHTLYIPYVYPMYTPTIPSGMVLYMYGMYRVVRKDG